MVLFWDSYVAKLTFSSWSNFVWKQPPPAIGRVAGIERSQTGDKVGFIGFEIWGLEFAWHPAIEKLKPLNLKH